MMMSESKVLLAAVFLLLLAVCGCRSPYHADRGALVGGATGAGLGAVIGQASGNAGAGALIGSAIGAVTGAAIGQEIDEEEAGNRAVIEQQLGRRMAEAVTIGDVVTMTKAGLSDDVITTHVRAHGMRSNVSAQDLITLKEQGVSDTVMRTMQQSPPRPVVVRQQPARPVIIEERTYYPYHSDYWRHRPRRHGGVNWGVSLGH